MKTKIFTLFLALFISVGTMFAFVYIDGIRYILNDTELTAEVDGVLNVSVENVNIPASISYKNKIYSVTRIGDSSFDNYSNLTSIAIPNSVTSIGNDAFSFCRSLTSINIPNSVTSIGYSAFEGCSSLVSLTIPNTITSIGGRFFRNCSSLTSVTIPDSVTSIGYSAFEGCSSLTSFEIPNGITIIEDGTFQYCTNLNSVIIPHSVKNIRHDAFTGCSSLTSIELPNVVSLASDVFKNCTSLQSITLSSNINYLGGMGTETFVGCISLNSVICYATTPPRLYDDVFDGLNYSRIQLSVPAQSITAYKTANNWKKFKIIPISAESIETTTINVVPSDRTVDISWPSVTNAASYEIVIKDKSDNVICTLVFNEQGQLASIVFNAPAREETTQSTGFLFTITGLDKGTEYDYTITAKDADGNVLNIESGSFSTTGADNSPTDIDNLNTLIPHAKIMQNGQVYIHRGDKIYTVSGQEVNDVE